MPKFKKTIIKDCKIPVIETVPQSVDICGEIDIDLGVIDENNEVVSHSDVLLVNGRKPRRNNDYGQPTQ